MGRVSNQIRSSDVTGWGIAAIVCGALAVLSANLAALLSPTMMSGLHTTRLEGGNLNQLHAQLADLRAENARISRENRTLLTRFDLLDTDSSTLTRRMLAVERSLPLLIEALPSDSDIDRSLLTASLGQVREDLREAEGGMVAIRQTEMFPLAAVPAQPMPPLPSLEAGLSPSAGIPEGLDLTPTALADLHAIALGPPLAPDAAPAHWEELLAEVGPLLIGLVPILSPANADTSSVRLLAGPLPSLGTAETLCARLTRVGKACEPASFKGTPLP